MKKAVLLLTIVAALLFSLAGCASGRPAVTDAPTAETAEVQTGTPAPTATPSRQDGERFEEVIMLEGMEETVKYEHVVNEALGFEMDYDYEMFTRESDAGRERFVSLWDDQKNPENYLEVTSSPKDADTAAAAIAEELSKDYEVYRDSCELDSAGSCIYLDASAEKGTNRMPEQLQAVYILPAPDGCRIATAHYSIEAAEGFGRRFSYMMNTLSVMDR